MLENFIQFDKLNLSKDFKVTNMKYISCNDVLDFKLRFSIYVCENLNKQLKKNK